MVLCLVGASVPAADAAAPGPCPAVMPVSEISASTAGGQSLAATGWTVSRGTQPESFSVRVLGVLAGGIAPGVDMIIVETDSPALERAGGIWAGMSGSPVYAADGRWIGAVAYGLSFGPSRIGGLTPAEDMVGLLGYSSATTSAAERDRVRLSAQLQREVAARPEVSARQAAAGLARLPVPVAVSGLRADRIDEVLSRLDLAGRTIPYSAAAAPAAPGDPAQIAPGGNFAAALAYGDVTAAATGTTTAVCDGMALAFGHPFTYRGEVNASAHSASAITIQDDPTLAPFKLANIGGTVGTLDQDRFVGIRSALGAAPIPIPVSSTVSDTHTGAARDGVTDINESRDVASLTPAHLITNIDRVIDRVGAGSSRVTWTATGTAGGQPFALTRENRFADHNDISFASSDELSHQLSALFDNRFAAVAFTRVRIDAELTPALREYRIDALERRVGTQWMRIDPSKAIPAVAGQPLMLRARLSSYQGVLGSTTVQLAVAVPAQAAGVTATLDVRGGATPPDEGSPSTTEPSTFAGLLETFHNALRNDEILAELRPAEDPTQFPTASVRRRLADVVTGHIPVPVDVQAAATQSARPAAVDHLARSATIP
jgi:hypothetical protein